MDVPCMGIPKYHSKVPKCQFDTLGFIKVRLRKNKCYKRMLNETREFLYAAGAGN